MHVAVLQKENEIYFLQKVEGIESSLEITSEPQDYSLPESGLPKLIRDILSDFSYC